MSKDNKQPSERTTDPDVPGAEQLLLYYNCITLYCTTVLQLRYDHRYDRNPTKLERFVQYQ